MSHSIPRKGASLVLYAALSVPTPSFAAAPAALKQTAAQVDGSAKLVQQMVDRGP